MSIEGKDKQHINTARLSALDTGRLCPSPTPQEITQVLISVRGHSAALRIKSPNSPDDPIRCRNRKLPGCSAVSTAIVPPHASAKSVESEEILHGHCS